MGHPHAINPPKATPGKERTDHVTITLSQTEIYGIHGIVENVVIHLSRNALDHLGQEISTDRISLYLCKGTKVP